MATSSPIRPQPADGSQTAVGRLAGLGNRLVELFGRKLSRRGFAAEMARLVADAMRLKAVAVLGYDRRRDRLVLLAEEGLKGDARGALGGGGDCAWDIPIRGLHNRRVSVIEAAHQNPFVPRPLIDLSPSSLSIASLPIYYDHEPTGVLLLFTAGSRAFSDAQLQTLSQALRVCGRGLRDPEAAMARGRGAKRPAESAASPAAADQAAAEAVGREGQPQLRVIEGQGASGEPAAPVEAPNAKIQALEQQLLQAREEAERNAQTVRMLTTSANALVRDRDNIAQQLADLERLRETNTAAVRAETDALQERLLAVESERVRYHSLAEDRYLRAQQSLKALEEERRTLLERTQTADTTIGDLQTVTATLTGERAHLTAQVETLTGQVRAGQEALQRAQTRNAEERSAIEADREAWKAQSTAVRAELAQRTNEFTLLDRELRSASVARDAASAQLQAARAEIDRLVALTEELGRGTTQLEAARAGTAAESASLSRTLEEERANRLQTEHALRADLATAQLEAEHLASELAAGRDEIAARGRTLDERDTQLANLRDGQEAARQAEANWQQTTATLRTEIASLNARLEQGAAEHQHVLDERAALRTALAELRQQASSTDIAQAASLGQLQAEATELRRQVEALSVERTGLHERHQRTVDEGRGLAARLAETQRRAQELSELLRQRDEALQTAATERQRQTTQLATLTGQLQAAQEAFERSQARATQERTSIEADRDGWKEQATAVRAELGQRTESLVAREHDLRAALVARDALATDLNGAREEVDRLTTLADELRHTITQTDSARAAALSENAGLRQTLEEERVQHGAADQALRGNLATAQTEAEQLAATEAMLRNELAERTLAGAERDERLATLRNEIELLRQQSADRGVLAQQASELGTKVVELEQLLAAARGDAARADRQRAAVTEALEAARRRETEAAAIASQDLTQFQTTVERLTEERGRLEAERAAQRSESEALRATLATLQDTVQQLRFERSAADEQGQATARQLADTQRRLDEVSAVLRQREATLESTIADRKRLTAQLAAVESERRLGQEAFEAATARYAQEQAALQADRDASRDQTAAARTERDQLLATAEELRRMGIQLDAAQRAAAAESATLRQTLEDERSASRSTLHALRGDLAAAQAEIGRLSAAAAALDGALGERDEQLATLQQQEEASRAAEAEWLQTRTTLRTELTTLRARVESNGTEIRQLREARETLEQQVALLSTTHGEKEQALVQALQAAREQVTQIEHERSTLRTALAETHEQLTAVDATHAALVTQLQSEAADLRKQLQALSAARTTLTERLERVEQERAGHAARVEEEALRAAEFAARCTELEQSLAAAEHTLAETRSQRATLTARLDALSVEGQQMREDRAAVERQLAMVVATHGEEEQALAQGLQAARQQVAQLEEERTTLRATLSETRQQLTEAEAAHAAALKQAEVETASTRKQVKALTAVRAQLTERIQLEGAAHVARIEEESQRAAALAEQCAQLEQSLATAEARRTATESAAEHARVEVAGLTERLTANVKEVQQLRDARGALEQQLSLAIATHSETEQERLHALQSLREQVTQLDQERSTLRASLDELEQQAKQNAAASGQAQGEAADLRKQVKALTNARAKLTERLQRLEQERATQDAGAQEERRRAAAVAEQCAALEKSLAAAELRQTMTDAALAQAQNEAATLTTHSQRNAAEVLRMRDAQAAVERQLAQAVATQQAREQAHAHTLQAAREQLAQLEQERTALRVSLAEFEQQVGDGAATLGEAQRVAADLDKQVQSLSATRTKLAQRLERAEQEGAAQLERVEAESRRAAALADQCTRLEQSLAQAESRRTALDADLLRARNEVEALRQQSADRGVLAHQAAELGSKVVELEQQVAAVRGEAARADRQRAVLAEELEMARQQHAQALAAVEHEQATLQAGMQQLADDRDRLAAEKVAHLSELEGQRATLADLQAAVEHGRAEQAQVEQTGHDAARRLAETHRRMEELSGLLAQRDTAVENATAERKRLAAQVNKLTSQLRAEQETLESFQGREALERAAIEADRDAWKDRAAASLAELDRLTAAMEQLNNRATELDAGQHTAAVEAAALRETIEDERVSRQQSEQLLRNNLTAVQAEVERLSHEATALRAALNDREEQLTVLRNEHTATQHTEAEWRESSAALRAHVSALDTRLDETTAECQRLRSQREIVEHQLAVMMASRGEAEQGLTQRLQTSQEQITRLEQDRGALQATLDEVRQRASDLEATHAAALEQLRAESTELRKQLKGLTTARTVLTERLEQAEQAQAVQAERINSESRQAATLADRCSQLEQSMAATEARRAALSGELTQARAEIEALRQHSADSGVLAQQASTLGNKVAELEQQLAVLRLDAARADRERTALTDELESTRRQAAEALAAAEREQATFEESLQRLAAERSRLEGDKANQRADIEAQRATVAQLQAALDQAQEEHVRAEEAQQGLTQRADEAQRRLDEITERLRQRETAIDSATAERQRLEDAVRAAESAAAALALERDTLLRRANETARTPIQPVASPIAAAAEPAAEEPPPVPPDGPFVIERSAPLGAVVDSTEPADAPTDGEPLRPQKAARTPGELVLLDVAALQADAGAALKAAGFEVTLAPPTEAAVDDLARRKVKCVMLNLAAGPPAWRTLRVLRERMNTRNVPILAYLMSPGAPMGFCFGRTDFALWPLDSARIIERLQRLRPKLKRLLFLSPDVDGVGRLREPLTQAGISTSIVLDGKQALEFASMVNPDAAVLHLTPNCGSVARALSGIRAAETFRDLPLLILLDKTPPPGEDGFLAATLRQLLGKATFQFTQLPEEIARVLG